MVNGTTPVFHIEYNGLVNWMYRGLLYMIDIQRLSVMQQPTEENEETGARQNLPSNAPRPDFGRKAPMNDHYNGSFADDGSKRSVHANCRAAKT